MAQRLVQVGDDLDRTKEHDINIVLDLYEGGHNDVAHVFIDDVGRWCHRRVGTSTRLLRTGRPPGHVNKVKVGQTVPMKWKFDG